MYKELNEIDYIVYFKKDHRYPTIIQNTNEIVENTGEPWFPEAYGNALIYLNGGCVSEIYLMGKGNMYNMPMNCQKQKQIDYLRKNAKQIVR